MKILNEFMAEKYIKKHGCSIAYTRPSVVFGYGRQNTAINWAEDFAAKPALGQAAYLPFSKKNRDNPLIVENWERYLKVKANESGPDEINSLRNLIPIKF